MISRSQDLSAPIFVAGASGMVGSALVRVLAKEGYTNILTPRRDALDLLDRSAVALWLRENRPTYVFLAAAKVGGILANNIYRAEFLHDNLVITTNVIDGCHRADVDGLMFFGSSCIYPRDCQQPIREDYLLTGPLEPTNEPYAIAKIAGLKLIEAYNSQYGRNYISVMPTNLYGPNDNYDLQNSHVLPALIHKFHRAKVDGAPSVSIWGTGTPKREFMYVDDLADACVFLMAQNYQGPMVNIGVGSDISIADIAMTVGNVVGYTGKLVFDLTKPDGTPRKLLDVNRIGALGWRAKTSLRDGIAQAYAMALAADAL